MKLNNLMPAIHAHAECKGLWSCSHLIIGSHQQNSALHSSMTVSGEVRGGHRPLNPPSHGDHVEHERAYNWVLQLQVGCRVQHQARQHLLCCVVLQPVLATLHTSIITGNALLR